MACMNALGIHAAHCCSKFTLLLPKCGFLKDLNELN